MKKPLYTIIDNNTGEKYETDTHGEYLTILENLKNNYTKYLHTESGKYIEMPYYIISSEDYTENEKMYKICYVDLRK